jgi:hypothetical protein
MALVRINGKLIEIQAPEEILEVIDQENAVVEMINFIYS